MSLSQPPLQSSSQLEGTFLGRVVNLIKQLAGAQPEQAAQQPVVSPEVQRLANAVAEKQRRVDTFLDRGFATTEPSTTSLDRLYKTTDQLSEEQKKKELEMLSALFTLLLASNELRVVMLKHQIQDQIEKNGKTLREALMGLTLKDREIIAKAAYRFAERLGEHQPEGTKALLGLLTLTSKYKPTLEERLGFYLDEEGSDYDNLMGPTGVKKILKLYSEGHDVKEIVKKNSDIGVHELEALRQLAFDQGAKHFDGSSPMKIMCQTLMMEATWMIVELKANKERSGRSVRGQDNKLQGQSLLAAINAEMTRMEAMYQRCVEDCDPSVQQNLLGPTPRELMNPTQSEYHLPSIWDMAMMSVKLGGDGGFGTSIGGDGAGGSGASGGASGAGGAGAGGGAGGGGGGGGGGGAA